MVLFASSMTRIPAPWITLRLHPPLRARGRPMRLVGHRSRRVCDGCRDLGRGSRRGGRQREGARRLERGTVCHRKGRTWLPDGLLKRGRDCDGRARAEWGDLARFGGLAVDEAEVDLRYVRNDV